MKNPDQLFINPDGNNKEEALQIMTSVTKILVDFLSNAGNQPLLPDNSKFSDLNYDLPIHGINHSEMEKELIKITRLSMNPANPCYIGHMDSLPNIYSIIASLYSAALNNNMFSLEMSPYFTRLEYALTRQFAALFGMPSTALGVFASGGTLSNIQAIITARNYFLKNNSGSISEANGRLVLFASEHAHISIKKAAMISGIGVQNLILVKADSDGKMDVQDLANKFKAAKEDGKIPFAVVGTLGTTITGSIDPAEEISAFCQKENCWFHADAVYGGAIILSKKQKHRLKGIESANSISFNPQKWMHISKTCSMLLFRDAEILKKYFSMKAHYVKEQDEFVNLSELSIQGTKPAEVLKLWLSILAFGLKGYEEIINNAYKVTEEFRQRLSKYPAVEFAAPCEMNIPTFRLKASKEKDCDDLNRQFNEYALMKHNLFFSLPVYNGKLWQRTILLNPFIGEPVYNKVASTIESFLA